MKTKFKIVLVALIFATNLVANGAGRKVELILQQEIILEMPMHLIEYDRDINRITFTPTFCYVSQEEGVVIEGLSDDILVYEIWDAEGTMCLAYFTDEESFLECLFSMSGDFILKFYYEVYVLYGDISL